MKRRKDKLVVAMFMFFMIISFVSAGVGIKYSEESILANEKEKNCISYKVYNPWPGDSYATIELSEELQTVLIMQEAEAKLIPADTSSDDAIPVEFCFKVPKVYERSCLVAGRFLCAQECAEPQKVYEGEVVVSSVPDYSGGGSATTAAVSAPLRIRVQCNAHPTDFTLLFIVLAVISLIVIVGVLRKKYGKPKSQRIKEKMKDLRKELKKGKK